MGRAERRLLKIIVICGVSLTLAVMLMDGVGALRPLENWLYDQRARRCQHFLRPPTDQIVYIDIDDIALKKMGVVVGSWPWRRSVLAGILDETSLAGAKVVLFDIIFGEPQRLEYEKENGSFAGIDHDANLAAAMARAGNVLVPASFTFVSPKEEPIAAAVRKELTADLELAEQEIVTRLKWRGWSETALAARVEETFLSAREGAMRERVHREFGEGAPAYAELRRRLLPKLDPAITGSPLLRLLREQYDGARRVGALRRFGGTIPGGLSSLPKPLDEVPPILPISKAAGYCGFADYLPYGDGVVRSVLLYADHHGQLFPHVGLVLACAMLSVDTAEVRVNERSVIIPRPQGGDIVIPVRNHDAESLGRVSLVMDIPWFGQSDWMKMWDYPAYRKTSHRLSIREVWDICRTRQRIETNSRTCRGYLLYALRQVDPGRAEALAAKPPSDEELDGVINQTLPLLQKTLTDLAAITQKSEEDQKRLDLLEAADKRLRLACKESVDLRSQLKEDRESLRSKLKGRAVLVGWTATGAIADLVTTSVHPKCPGVVGHGVICNAILTGELWRTMPGWVTAVFTAALGLATTLYAVRLSPWKSLSAVVVTTAGYLAFNGVFLFDYRNLIVGMAGPLVCAAVVFTVLTVTRLLHEITERAAIARRFSRYTDPALVNYLLEHPEQASMKGQVRELSVVFTDLVGFTPLTEKLRERTVLLLNDYMGRMVPVIRAHRGYVNKFLGDGIMFFFGAPWNNPDHAVDAVAAVLEMHAALEAFNVEQGERGMPSLEMRAGISTGNVVVGDAGPDEACDYTVLGDAVNLASRLESANKAFGTHTLLSERTAEVLESKFLLRPIGRVRVVGKEQGVMVFEALAERASAGEEQTQLAEMTRRVVESFLAGRTRQCLEAIHEMDQSIGQTKLTRLYRELCEKYVLEPPGDVFDGQISLTEK